MSPVPRFTPCSTPTFGLAAVSLLLATAGPRAIAGETKAVLPFRIVVVHQRDAMPDARVNRTSPDGKLRIEPDHEAARATLVDVPTGKALAELVHRRDARPRNRQVVWTFSPDGQYLVVASTSENQGGGDGIGDVRVWHVATRRVVARPAPRQQAGIGLVHQLAFIDDGTTLLIRCDDTSGK